MPEIYAGRSSEFIEGKFKIISSDDCEVGVVRADGRLHAVRNICPHQGGPVCEGLLIHKPEDIIDEKREYRGMRFTETLHLACPWHGWEFDLITGEANGLPAKKVKKYEVIERDENVYVVI